jgi:hypothetical protein
MAHAIPVQRWAVYDPLAMFRSSEAHVVQYREIGQPNGEDTKEDDTKRGLTQALGGVDGYNTVFLW